MNTPQSSPAIASGTPSRHRFTVAEFERMVAAQVWPEDERLELIQGELVTMSPINASHVAVVNVLAKVFSRALAHTDWLVSVQNPIELDRLSRPQPDLALIAPPADQYRERLPRPADIGLLIEVSDTTLRYDRREKLPLYARAGIVEVWLVDLAGGKISAHCAPDGDDYTQVMTYARGQVLMPVKFPELRVAVADVLGSL